MHRAGLLAALALALSAPAAHGGEPRAPLCSQGTFAVTGEALVPGLASELPDLVTLEDGTLSIAGGTTAAQVSLRQTRRGTVLRGRLARAGAARHPFGGSEFKNELAALSWNALMGLVGFSSPHRAAKAPRIKALIDPECRVMTGKLRGGGLRRTFVATAVYGEPVCGTIVGIGCAEGAFCELPPDTCQSADLAGVCVSRDVGCTLHWDPVCGCDGVTYGNDCERVLAGAQKEHDGACEAEPLE